VLIYLYLHTSTHTQTHTHTHTYTYTHTQRFKAFHPLKHPEPLTYTDFTHHTHLEAQQDQSHTHTHPTTSPTNPHTHTHTHAQDCFRAVKGLLDHGLNIKKHLKDHTGTHTLTSLARVAVSNSVALMQVARKIDEVEQRQTHTHTHPHTQKGEKEMAKAKAKVELSYTAHKQFPVLKVTVVEEEGGGGK
jgi:hypothetical protein